MGPPFYKGPCGWCPHAHMERGSEILILKALAVTDGAHVAEGRYVFSRMHESLKLTNHMETSTPHSSESVQVITMKLCTFDYVRETNTVPSLV